MEQLKSSTQQLKDHVGEYVSTYIQITKAKATQGASKAAVGAAIGIASFLLALFFLFFLFCGVAFWLGNVIENRQAGFFIVAGFFGLLILLVFALRKKVIGPFVQNAIISKIYE